MLAACGPPDEKVRTEEEAVRVAREHCHGDASIGGWRAERNGDIWIARLGELDSQGGSRFSARINAKDGKPACDVNLSWSSR